MNIIGRLTRDAQVRTTPNGKQVVNFSVAVNDSYKTKQGERVEQTLLTNSWIEYTDREECDPKLKETIHLLFGHEKMIVITINV